MSGTSSALGEAAFAALPETLQAKIDDAFTSISHSNPPQTGSGFAAAAVGRSGGGFIVEDAVIDEAQGDTAASARIPLASIPAALELLDLPPNDRQILAVFRDAAESDDEDDAVEYGANGKETSVSRSQWRAVCAVLLEGSSSPSSSSPSPPSHSSPPRQREERKTRPRRSKAAYSPISAVHPADADTYDSGDDSEPYVASDNSDHDLEQDKDQYDVDDGDDSDDEYTGPAASTSKLSRSTKAAKAATTKSPKKSLSGPNAVPDSEASLDAFALFFPSIPRDSDELKAKKIMLKDLQAAMKSAGEKYKADDLKEMLDLFSTSPDKSISFADFENVMAATRLA
ncbi:hypothetical protein BDN71DRAFT_1435834 [Pleurotus eryngii]|uniref:Uncharacterized protein n=1 Tax=Pleurotus eryngii TaxID=5323 RepID=A0A9P6D1I8_PLEER|nr:hypothetical protein BDN71DRAFT_1435834 [Pleurotus eryngii]